MKVLVVLSNYGTKNDPYLQRISEEYRKMPYNVDLVVLSNISKDLGPDIIDLGDFERAWERLAGERFDCVLLSNILHLIPDPLRILSSFTELLAPQGRVIAGVPNFGQLPIVWRRFRHDKDLESLGNYQQSRVHQTTHRVVRDWFQRCGLAVEKVVDTIPRRAQQVDRLSLGLAHSLLASEFVMVGRKV